MRRKYFHYYFFVLLGILFVNAKCFAIEATAELAAQHTSPSSKYVSLDFREINVRDLLQLLAEFSGKNIVISDKITGKISVTLTHATWDEALNLILRMQGLAKQETDNTFFIFAAGQKSDALSVLPSVKVLNLHYAQAEDVAALLAKQKGLLSATGNVSADARTNALLVQEIQPNFSAVRAFVKEIDVPVKQILLEGKIISIDSNYASELGLKFGTAQEEGDGGGDDGDKSNKKSGDMNMDLPLSVSDPGHFVFALAKLGNNTILNMELSALESAGHANIMSSPKLLTANHKSAYIESGQEIPYQEKTSSGATNIAFKKAVLSLKVTPDIITNDKVVLHLQMNQDKLSSLKVEGVPAIQTQEIQTQVEVHNNQTLVLGGIYEVSNTDNVVKIPFLSTIPLLGKLFQSKQTETQRKELLIFITPRIVD